MVKRSHEVETYINGLSETRRDALETLRGIVHELVPDVVESMQYRMPTFATDTIFCAFASQKNYISLYVMNTEIVARHRQELGELDIGKSFIRFNKLEDLPPGLLKEIIKEAAHNPGLGPC